MPTTAERQALVFLTAVALLGGGVRVWQNHQLDERAVSPPASGGEHGENVGNQLAAIESARPLRKGKTNSNGKSAAKTTKPAPYGQAKVDRALVDMDVANADQIASLPHMNASLAERVVANRDSLGAFGSLTRLARVQGFNKTLRTAVEPWVIFSGGRTHWDGPVDSLAVIPHHYEGGAMPQAKRSYRTPRVRQSSASPPDARKTTEHRKRRR